MANNIKTIYQPTALYPYNVGIDMSKPQTFSAIVNGLQFDSYELKIRKLDNTLLYDSGSTSSILSSNANIQYSGTWSNASSQIIDDTNKAVQYYGYGWSSYSNSPYYNKTVHSSKTANDYALLNFVGTGIEVYFTEGVDKGTVQIFIDDVDKGTIDTYVVGTGLNKNNFQVKAFSATDLELGNHTIKLLVTGNKNGSSSSSMIELDYFKVLNNNAAKSSSTKNNYFQYTFTSNGVELYMDKTPDAGLANIYIDGVYKKQIDLYSSSYDLSELVYSNYNLSTGSHTIKVLVVGSKNSQSKGAKVSLQSLTTVSRTILASKLYDKDTFSITIPANTVTYRGGLKWQLILWNGSNDGECVTSGEMIFTNMSIPSVNFTVPSLITNKQNTFTATYGQAENIPLKVWNMKLYALNYIVNEGYFGQELSGEVLDGGSFGSSCNGRFVDEGFY